jgi:hypothetical protein
MALRGAAAGLLNTRVYIEKGSDGRIHLADNLADAVEAALRRLARASCRTPR